MTVRPREHLYDGSHATLAEDDHHPMTQPDKDVRRTELGEFLRAQRGQLQPVEVGLPSGRGRRRTPGLRREEVAQLAGVGLTWYTWLEQGRDIPASREVVDALAHAMRMTPDQHRHLRVLADLPAPAHEPAPAGAQPRLQRLVDACAPNAACALDARLDFLAWNAAYVRVRGHDPAAMPPGRRNLVWAFFDDSLFRAQLAQWEPAARAVLSQFRAAAGQHAGDARFTELIAALAQVSTEFKHWWADYSVSDFAPTTLSIDHADVGHLALELFQLHPAEHPDVVVVIQVPATADARRRVESLLANERGDEQTGAYPP